MPNIPNKARTLHDVIIDKYEIGYGGLMPYLKDAFKNIQVAIVNFKRQQRPPNGAETHSSANQLANQIRQATFNRNYADRHFLNNIKSQNVSDQNLVIVQVLNKAVWTEINTNLNYGEQFMANLNELDSKETKKLLEKIRPYCEVQGMHPHYKTLIYLLDETTIRTELNGPGNIGR
jgi:hypothetical protein